MKIKKNLDFYIKKTEELNKLKHGLIKLSFKQKEFKFSDNFLLSGYYVAFSIVGLMFVLMRLFAGDYIFSLVWLGFSVWAGVFALFFEANGVKLRNKHKKYILGLVRE